MSQPGPPLPFLTAAALRCPGLRGSKGPGLLSLSPCASSGDVLGEGRGGEEKRSTWLQQAGPWPGS